MSHNLLDAEASRAHIEECEQLKRGKCFTIITDGWEDLMKRSLYGTIAARVGELPVVLSLDDLTGKRGSADNILNILLEALMKMALPPENCIAITTDNPTVMGSTRGKFVLRFPWILVKSSYLHPYLQRH